jgi:hypothetical protein
MNEQLQELYRQSIQFTNSDEYLDMPNKQMQRLILTKYAELIVRECMRMCDVASVGHESHGHIKEANGCSSAKEYIADHFEVEEQTVSQKMAEAGYTRRPRGWTKEDSE